MLRRASHPCDLWLSSLCLSFSQQCHRESRQGTCMGSRWRWPVATRAPSVGQETDRAGLLLLRGGVTDFKAVPWRLGGCHEPGGCWCELLGPSGERQQGRSAEDAAE